MTSITSRHTRTVPAAETLNQTTHVFFLSLVFLLCLGQQSVGLLQFGLREFLLQVTPLVDFLQTLQRAED